MEQNDLVTRAWERACFRTGSEAKEILELRANQRALLGPNGGCIISSSTTEGSDALSSDERSFRSTSQTTWTLVVRGRPARSNSWFQSHDEIPGGTISLWGSDFAHGKAVEVVREQVLLRLRTRLEEVLMRNAPKAFQAEWTALVAAQLAAWEAEDAAVITAAQASWDEEDRLAVEADDLKTRAHNLSKLPAGNELGDAPALFDSWHSPIEELRDRVATLRTWLAAAEEQRTALLATRREVEIAASLAKEERLAVIATAMAAPATPAAWFIGKYGVDVAAIEASTGRTRGEGLGDQLAGARETRYLPGDRSLVALRISGGRGSRYHCEVSTHGLQTLPGGGISTTIHGRRDETLIAVVVDENWHVIERHFKDGVTERYAVTNRHGTATLYPDTGEMCQSRGWSDEGTGPTDNEVRKILGLRAAPTLHIEEPIRAIPTPTAPPPKPVEARPAAPAAVAATLASLQGKFKKR